MRGFLHRWCLLEYIAFFLQWKHGLVPGLVPVGNVVSPLFPPFSLNSLFSSLVYSVMDMIPLPCTYFESHWKPTQCGATEVCAHGTSWMLHVNGIAEEADMRLHRFSLTIGMIHCPFALHSQNTTSKIKLFKFSGWRQPSNESSAGPCTNFTGHVPMKWTPPNCTSFQVATGLKTAGRESLIA